MLTAGCKTGGSSPSGLYGASADGEWLFGESEAYLRETGALNETFGFAGKSVIVTNYIQEASKSIATAANLYVCYADEHEEILNETEASAGAPIEQPGFRHSSKDVGFSGAVG